MGTCIHACLRAHMFSHHHSNHRRFSRKRLCELIFSLLSLALRIKVPQRRKRPTWLCWGLTGVHEPCPFLMVLTALPETTSLLSKCVLLLRALFLLLTFIDQHKLLFSVLLLLLLIHQLPISTDEELISAESQELRLNTYQRAVKPGLTSP